MWHSTSGKIIHTDIQLEKEPNLTAVTGSAQPKNLYRPEIKFEYTVGRKRYISVRRVMGITPSYASVALAVLVIERYPMGKAVTVYYDQSHPNKGVLERNL